MDLKNKKRITNKDRKQQKINNAASDNIKNYEMLTQDENRLKELRKELEDLKKMGLSESKLKTASHFYQNHPRIDINNVSRCLETIIKFLKAYKLSEQEIKTYLERNGSAYINIYKDLVIRIKKFAECKSFKKDNKQLDCGCLEYVIRKMSSLLSAENQSINNTKIICEYIEENKEEIDLDYISDCMQTNKKLKLTKRAN